MHLNETGYWQYRYMYSSSVRWFSMRSALHNLRQLNPFCSSERWQNHANSWNFKHCRRTVHRSNTIILRR